MDTLAQKMELAAQGPLNIFSLLILICFATGYALITFEGKSHLNKTAVALVMAALCWTVQFFNPFWSHAENEQMLSHHLGETAQIVFFLLGALCIVETINVHKGFAFIARMIRVSSLKTLLWVISLIAFFLSSVLDNLTTTVVMVSLLMRMIEKTEDRLLIGGAIVIAANAGGAWTPIGDVTTTMLWIGGQVSALAILKQLVIPSLVCLVVAVFVLSCFLKGKKVPFLPSVTGERHDVENSKLIFFLGLGLLLAVPVFKIVTGLPPYIGMLCALGILWLVTDMLYRGRADKDHFRMPAILTKIDLSAALFFLGILLCIDALESARLLNRLAEWMSAHIGSLPLIATSIGLFSAIVDNVPLVAASMGMYPLSYMPQDSSFWLLVAFCAGTGGSILIIGSAAGVVFMGLEKADFIWYMKRISIPALLGYFAGIGSYLLLT